jgi:hypothetical protein
MCSGYGACCYVFWLWCLLLCALVMVPVVMCSGYGACCYVLWLWCLLLCALVMVPVVMSSGSSPSLFSPSCHPQL